MMKIRKSVGIITRIKQTQINVKDNIINTFTKFEKKVEGTIAENWVKYWKILYRDYKDVALDIVKDVKEKPSKAILIGSTSGLLTYFAKHNPDKTSFRDAFLTASNDAALVHPTLLRDDIRLHLNKIESSYNTDIIRYSSFGIFSFIWIDNHSPKVNKFEAQCSYLKLKYSERIDRIVDVGFLDVWWILTKKMTNYDINY